jgi:hypothetical protein
MNWVLLFYNRWYIDVHSSHSQRLVKPFAGRTGTIKRKNNMCFRNGRSYANLAPIRIIGTTLSSRFCAEENHGNSLCKNGHAARRLVESSSIIVEPSSSRREPSWRSRRGITEWSSSCRSSIPEGHRLVSNRRRLVGESSSSDRDNGLTFSYPTTD